MTTYTFAQLEGLWIQAGGSKALAPLMAGVAEVESGGNPQAENPSGATGLWQIEWPLYRNLVPGATSRQAYFNPQINAAAAVKLSRNTMAGIQANWLAFEPPGAAEAIAKKNGGTVPQSVSGSGSGQIGGTTGSRSTNSSGSTATGTTGSSSTAGTATGTGPDPNQPGGIIGFAEGLPVIGGLVSALEPLLHAVATVIDYSFAMFEPGQGLRLLFGLGAVVLAFLAYRVIAGSGTLPKAGVL